MVKVLVVMAIEKGGCLCLVLSNTLVPGLQGEPTMVRGDCLQCRPRWVLFWLLNPRVDKEVDLQFHLNL